MFVRYAHDICPSGVIRFAVIGPVAVIGASRVIGLLAMIEAVDQ